MIIHILEVIAFILFLSLIIMFFKKVLDIKKFNNFLKKQKEEKTEKIEIMEKDNISKFLDDNITFEEFKKNQEVAKSFKRNFLKDNKEGDEIVVDFVTASTLLKNWEKILVSDDGKVIIKKEKENIILKEKDEKVIETKKINKEEIIPELDDLLIEETSAKEKITASIINSINKNKEINKNDEKSQTTEILKNENKKLNHQKKDFQEDDIYTTISNNLLISFYIENIIRNILNENASLVVSKENLIYINFEKFFSTLLNLFKEENKEFKKLIFLGDIKKVTKEKISFIQNINKILKKDLFVINTFKNSIHIAKKILIIFNENTKEEYYTYDMFLIVNKEIISKDYHLIEPDNIIKAYPLINSYLNKKENNEEKPF